MCTLTWWRGEEGTREVFFNRDEKKTRSQAEWPREYQEGGTRFLSPRDPDGGGTWMLANEHGVILCLLNRWHEETQSSKTIAWRSRGQLVWSLAGVRSAREVENRLRELDLRSVKPFSLWAFDDREEIGVDWTEGDLKLASHEMPVTSSSFRYEEVAAARKENFSRLSSFGREDLHFYHGGASEEASAYTVRMCRPDAQTMSQSRLWIDAHEIRWEYLEEHRDLAGEPETVLVVLPRY